MGHLLSLAYASNHDPLNRGLLSKLADTWITAEWNNAAFAAFLSGEMINL